ncbi:MAG: AI-2E family transporter, partial [Proteobacteria bacterium]|nr:AI-2E family transporter [Pseudomonadota bacterium]
VALLARADARLPGVRTLAQFGDVRVVRRDKPLDVAALNPLVLRLSYLGVPRWLGALAVICVFFFGIGLIVSLSAPWLVRNVSDFVRDLPSTLLKLQNILDTLRIHIEQRIGVNIADASSQISFSQFGSTAINWLTGSLRSVGSTAQAVMSSLEILVIVPFAVFYFLADWERVVRGLQQLVPLRLRRSVFTLTGEIDAMIGGYFRGQTLVCLFLGSFYAVALWLVGLRYGLVIGAISGLLSFIPYLGTGTCLILSVGFGLAQFYPEWQMIILILAVIGVGQFLEGNILTPYFVGRHVGVHPLALMFGLIALGKLYGFLGLLLSVPITGTIMIVLKRIARRYRASDFFRQ